MSEANNSSKTKYATINPVNPPKDTESSHQVTPAKVSLQEAINRGWEWVVYSWKTLRLLGGPVEITRSLFLLSLLLMKRTLVQWGIIKKT